MKPRMFVSYSSEDSVFVRKLLDSLQRSKAFDLWHDSINLRNGQILDTTIKKGILDCHIVLFYLSSAAINSAWVRQEYSWAIAKGRGIVSCVLNRDGTRKDPKLWDDLPKNRRMITLNEDTYHEPLLELTTSLLSDFYEHLFPGVMVDSVLNSCYKLGIERIRFGGFTEEDDERLKHRIHSSKYIKIMMSNGSSLIQHFKPSFQEFCKQKKPKLDLLLADEKSVWYSENSILVSPIFEDNKDNQELVNRAIDRMKGIFIERPKGLRVKKFNTQFRMTMIIFDDKYVHLTINLPPSESINGFDIELAPSKAELSGGSLDQSYVHHCVEHFNKVFEISKKIL